MALNQSSERVRTAQQLRDDFFLPDRSHKHAPPASCAPPCSRTVCLKPRLPWLLLWLRYFVSGLVDLVSGGDDAPWIPAGLAASVVLLVALSAREVVMRRAWTRYLLDQGHEKSARTSGEHRRTQQKSQSNSGMSAAWRNVQKHSEEADAGANPEAHFDVFHLCQDYLAAADDTLRSNTMSSERRNSIRAERARLLQNTTVNLGQRFFTRVTRGSAAARTSERLKQRTRALHCLDSSLHFIRGD